MSEPPEWVICFLPDGPGGPRAHEPLTEVDARKIAGVWAMLGGDPERVDVDHRSGTTTAYDPRTRKVRFGSDVYPGLGRSPNEAMSMPAVVAHELRHLERHDEGVAFDDADLASADEALTSLEATRYLGLTTAERWQLIWDALQRLHGLRNDPRLPIEPTGFLARHLRMGLTQWVEERDHGY